ncbi:histone acetyltransferase type b catalytic [Nesidiocoris tenuis]|uniref:Histone acetyltransferase type B catalytic subunit n=1 Tax=Nesidiocoris tenuis TaxID=355587 RepID=A0ABN7AFF4_9HEMI|nr:histone acetyltransferase type b catalytic [Nesidiocoris tenuis]
MSNDCFSEKIYGYKNLRISLYYSAARLNIYLSVKYDDTADTCSPKSIEQTITQHYETDIMDNLDQFEKMLNEEESFRPAGTLLHSFNLAGKDSASKYEIFFCDSQTPKWLAYHSRIQTFLHWFIDGASYIVVDDNWKFFVLYEKYVSPLTNDVQYAIIGYATVYEYYAYPANIRPRISQVLVLPPFQKKGLGAILLSTIQDHYSKVEKVLDITVEDPSANFQITRDFVDCIRCRKLPGFSKEKLKNGYSDDMANESREQFKINKKQSRRVYEILRLLHTDRNDEESFRNFRLCVKKRLNGTFQRGGLLRMIQSVSNGTSDNMEDRRQKLQLMFEDILLDYTEVVNRLEKYDGLPVAEL